MVDIPTAKELIKDISYLNLDSEVITKYMISFAKLHVEAALKAANENVRMKDVLDDHHNSVHLGDDLDNWVIIDEDTILNAYPLTNIK